MWYSISTNKDDTDGKIREFNSKFDKLIALLDYILHQNQIYSPNNDVEYDAL